MSDVIYKSYTIKLRSLYDPVKIQWQPLSIVWWNEQLKRIGYPIVSRELQVTEARANAVALERAKAWVDAKEREKGT